LIHDGRNHEFKKNALNEFTFNHRSNWTRRNDMLTGGARLVVKLCTLAEPFA